MIAHTIARFAPPIRRSSVRCSVLCATLGLAFAVLATAAAGQTDAAGEARAEDHSPQSFHGKAGAEVSRVLARDGRAPVIVALAQPQTRPVHRRRIPALVAEVAAMQRAVLDPLQFGDFQATHVYSVVPALAGWTTPAGLERLARHPYVLRVGVDRPVRAALAESVPHIGADRWHDEGIQGNGVTVAVLDSGVDTAHADLSGALVAEECFLERAPGKCPDGTGRQSGPGAAADNDGHGTHVSGIVLSSAGVSPGASLAALKVTDDDGNGAVSDLVAALEFILTDLPAVQVINMSLGTPTTFAAECDDEDADNRTLAWILNVLRALGVTPIAASGNHTSQTSMASPACLSGVVSVGATDKQDGVASFTNVSPELDLMAPGVGIESSGLGGGTDTKSGTSMAAPHASGDAALLLQSGFATTPAEVEAWLTTSQVSVQTAGQEFPRLECLPPDHHLTFYRLEPSAAPLDWVVQVEDARRRRDRDPEAGGAPGLLLRRAAHPARPAGDPDSLQPVRHVGAGARASERALRAVHRRLLRAGLHRHPHGVQGGGPRRRVAVGLHPPRPHAGLRGVDDACCSEAWDQRCVDLVWNVCGLRCP